MLSEREVISTLNMLRNEHLDVRTVTLGVSLFDCVSHDLDLFTANVKAKLRRYASQLVSVCNEVGDKYGIPVVNKRISVSPIAVVGAPFGPDGMVRVCKALDEAAKEAGVDFLGGFSAAPEENAETLRAKLSAGLESAKVDLSVLVRPAIKGQWGTDLHCEPFVVTADGPDKPGLIAAMSRVFAQHGVNIESLKAILGEGGNNHALFVFEVMVPDSVDMGRLRRELDCEGQKRDLRVSAQHRDIFEAVHRVNSF